MAKHFSLNQQSRVKHTLAIMSAKGGVGKSTLTALIATHLARSGKKVGILDADIIGSSISRIFALKEKVLGQAGLILPLTTPLGINVIASQLLLDQPDDPIVWRSPLVLDLIRQFYVDGPGPRYRLRYGGGRRPGPSSRRATIRYVRRRRKEGRKEGYVVVV